MTETIETTEIKAAHTQYAVADFIKSRFSPLAFSEKNIPQEAMNTILEAASWAASAMNEQPWEYYVAHKDTEGFEKIWSCLSPSNQPWTKNAAALIIAVYRKTYTLNGNPNGAAEHDLGMANANLVLQARALDIFSHQMGGFDRQKAAIVLQLDSNRAPFCVIALGYLGDVEQLDEPYKSRELMGRTRKPLNEFVKKV